MPDCPECGHEVGGDDDFCSECGNELPNQYGNEFQDSNDSKSTMSKVMSPKGIFLSLIGVIILFGFVIPLPYTDTEIYTEREPYSDTETTYETQTYQETVCNEDTAQYDVEFGNTEDSYYENINLRVTNGEEEAITVTMKVYFFNEDLHPYDSADSTEDSDASVSETNRFIVQGTETKTVNFESELEASEYDMWYRYEIVEAPTVEDCREVTRTEEVPQEETVTKYREVEKERTVTKWDPLLMRDRISFALP